ncbi:MAG: hypothetical protein AAGA96_16430 [Verrucomicrobiota bacterium]
MGSETKISVVAPPAGEVERLDLDPFYKKYLNCDGFPIVSSGRVSDAALREAAYLIGKMLGHRSDLLKAMIDREVRLVVMAPDEFTTDVPEHATLVPKAYWDKRTRGLGATDERLAVSVGEENLLGLEGDPYAEESIMVHEFGHAIHEMAMKSVDPEFQGKLELAFNQAGVAGLWKGFYAGTNPAEYWAEGVQSWFDTNRENDDDHNHVDTREELIEHDPMLAELIGSVFGQNSWRYQKPGSRDSRAHLAEFDWDAAPKFEWPERLIEAYETYLTGEDREVITLQPMEDLKNDSATGDSGPAVSIRFENKTDRPVKIFWVGFDGVRREYHTLLASRRYEQGTYGGHLWIVTGEDGKDIGWLRAINTNGKVEIK